MQIGQAEASGLLMVSRRTFSAGLIAGLAAPAARPASAQGTGDVRAAIASMPRLHALLVGRGDEVVVAAAQRGAGLTM